MTHPYLLVLLARARTEDLDRDVAVARRGAEAGEAAKPRRFARARRRRRPGVSTERATSERTVTLRCYSAEDPGRRACLAAVDRSEPARQLMPVAEVADELRAALSLSEGSLVAEGRLR